MRCSHSMCMKLAHLPSGKHYMDESLADRDWLIKLQGKSYADDEHKALQCTVAPRDQVLVHNQKPVNKFSSPFTLKPTEVVEKSGDDVVVKRTCGSARRHHTSHVKQHTLPDYTALKPAEHEDQPVCEIPMSVASPHPQRTRVSTGYLKDYVN